MTFHDKFGEPIEDYYEAPERQMMARYIKPHHRVLEIGGRYGVVSHEINKLLNDRTHHVVVEPDKSVFAAMWRNRIAHKDCYLIFSGAISDKPLAFAEEVSDHKYAGWGNYTKPWEVGEDFVSIDTIAGIEDSVNFTFNALVADCEGAIQQILIENESKIKNFELVIIERDGNGQSNYDEVCQMLVDSGMTFTDDSGLMVFQRLENV